MMNQANFMDLLGRRDLLCPCCRRKMIVRFKIFKRETVKGMFLYEYNDFFSDLLVQYKEGMDEALSPVFLFKYRYYLRFIYRGYTIVPMPSSRKKAEERGFSHVARMFELIGLPILECLEKSTDQKQVWLSKGERKKMRDQIRCKEGVSIPTKIVLVDDVCTTGSTLQGVLEILKNRNVKIKIFVVSLAEESLR